MSPPEPRPHRSTPAPGTASPRTIEPWFVAYALVGAVAAGLVPIVLPLWAIRSGDAAHVGLVVAASSLGLLGAPLWGALADRRRWHRPVFAAGLVLAGGALAVMAIAPRPAVLVAAAFAWGVGVAATTTVANLFVVERTAKERWGARLGALQTFYGVGQVVGLVLAGALGVADLRVAMGLAAALPFAALLLAGTLPRMPLAAAAPRPSLAHLHLRAEPLFASLAHSYRLVTWHRVLRVLTGAPRAFRRFAGLWFVLNVGSALVFAFYPLLMADAYGVGAGVASAGFAVAAAVGLGLYAPAGRWVGRHGGARVLQAAAGVRIGTFAGLGALAFAPLALRGPLALLLFAVTVLAWSLLSVAGTTLAASSGLPEGEAVGAYGAVGAIGGVTGALLGGWLVRYAGYGALPLAAAVLTATAVAMSRGLRPSAPAAADPRATLRKEERCTST